MAVILGFCVSAVFTATLSLQWPVVWTLNCAGTWLAFLASILSPIQFPSTFASGKFYFRGISRDTPKRNSIPNLGDFSPLFDWETWLWNRKRNVLCVCLTSVTCRWVSEDEEEFRGDVGDAVAEKHKNFQLVRVPKTFSTWFVVFDIFKKVFYVPNVGAEVIGGWRKCNRDILTTHSRLQRHGDASPAPQPN